MAHQGLARFDAETEHVDVLYRKPIAEGWVNFRTRIRRRKHGGVEITTGRIHLAYVTDRNIDGATALPKAEARAEFERDLISSMTPNAEGPRARVDYFGTWRQSALTSMVDAKPERSAGAAESLDLERGEYRGSSLTRRAKQRTTATSGWHEVRSTTAQPAFIDLAAKVLGGRFTATTTARGASRTSRATCWPIATAGSVHSPPKNERSDATKHEHERNSTP